MENWFNDFEGKMSESYPWMVKFLDAEEQIKELQLSGETAQSVADYVRRVENAATILFIAKLDNSWK